MKTYTYKKGDLIKHRASFLRNTGWYTNVPIDGKVTDPMDGQMDDRYLMVQWCDSDVPVMISRNVILPVSALDPS